MTAAPWMARLKWRSPLTNDVRRTADEPSDLVFIPLRSCNRIIRSVVTVQANKRRGLAKRCQGHRNHRTIEGFRNAQLETLCIRGRNRACALTERPISRG